ncbi:MAG: ATPase domain-containing protein [Candidatus Micrarchaeia archaeon]
MIDPRRYLKTGITGFDDIIGNGILKESIISLSGPTGCGKTTFAMQFLVEGALKFQQPGLYICLEDSKKSLLSNMSIFNWNLEKMEESKQLFFLDYPVHEVSQLLDKEGAVKEIISTMGIERIVIDSIMPIALYFKSEDERQREFLNFIANMREWGTTTMVISEDTNPDPNAVLPQTKFGLEKLTDGWVHIYYLRNEKGGRERAIEVIKMKGSSFDSKIYPIEISDLGFSVLKKSISLKDLRR